MGARLARPDRLCINIMGDAAFGMVGMDFETAVRCRIPILTVVLNNGLMGGYREWMPDAVERACREPARRQLRRARARARRSRRARRARVASCAAAIERCIASVESGRAALLEVMTCEEQAIAGEH